MLELLHGGAIDEVHLAQASFGFALRNAADNTRMNARLGGGVLLDAGSYPMSLIRLVTGSAPARVTARARWASRRGDIGMMATLEYRDDLSGTGRASRTPKTASETGGSGRLRSTPRRE
jgi:predicted dehydrogenase